MSDEDFLKRLKELAILYDRENGRWVESRYQGQNVFNWIADHLGSTIQLKTCEIES